MYCVAQLMLEKAKAKTKRCLCTIRDRIDVSGAAVRTGSSFIFKEKNATSNKFLIFFLYEPERYDNF